MELGRYGWAVKILEPMVTSRHFHSYACLTIWKYLPIRSSVSAKSFLEVDIDHFGNSKMSNQMQRTYWRYGSLYFDMFFMFDFKLNIIKGGQATKRTPLYLRWTNYHWITRELSYVVLLNNYCLLKFSRAWHWGQSSDFVECYCFWASSWC